MSRDTNRNPEGFNQWVKRTDEEIQVIINKHPNFTKKDFRGKGKLNSRKILTRKETERPGLKFGLYGKRKVAINEIFKLSSLAIFKYFALSLNFLFLCNKFEIANAAYIFEFVLRFSRLVLNKIFNSFL